MLSFLDGYGTTAQVASRIAELGHSACACTDHGNVICHVPYEHDMMEAGVKPIFGCEFYVVEKMQERGKIDPALGVMGFPHVTVLARNQKGYENLLKLSTLSWLEGYYYKPRLDWDVIARHQEGLVVLSGCVGGFPSQICNNLGPEAAHTFIAERRRQIEHYYVELIPQPGLDICHSSFPHLAAIARDLQVPAVLTADAHFPRPEDWNAEDTMVCIATSKTRKAVDRKIQLPEFQYYCTEQELLQRARDVMAGREWDDAFFLQAITNTGIIAEACNVEIPKAAPIAFPGIALESTSTVLRLWCEEGMARRLSRSTLVKSREKEYRDRMERELKVVESKGFAGYIMVLTDLAAWIKAQDGLVMCRGSAGGCLLLWLLGCSETDSIVHGLSFERFYDESRTDPPDIDMDFEVSMKDRVYGYLAQKYGEENCAQICAITLMRARNALADFAAVHGIPSDEIAALSTALDSKDDDVDRQLSAVADPGALAVLKKWPVLRGVEKLVGQAKNQTVHAAGVLVSSRPIGESVALMRPRGGEGNPISTCDKHGAAALGFLKLDLLSVAAFDVTANAARRIGANTAFLYDLPMDDPKVYETARAHKVAGVFQIDGAASRVADQIGLERFEELYAASALCRPGACDHVPLYVKNKYDKTAFGAYLSSLHPLAAAIVADTYGVLLYQEQVMRICRDCANMSWPRVNKLRKRISAASFNGHELGAEYGDEFNAGCVANGMSAQEAAYWWDAIKKHGVYSFNKSHCVTYGIVGYWMLWLKTYYPEAYYEAYLDWEGRSSSRSELLMKRLVREYRAFGGAIEVLDPTCSRVSFYSPEPGRIVGGWSNIGGVGLATAEKIVAAGPFRDWAHAREHMPPGVWYRLYESGATGHLDWDPQGAIELAPWLPVPAAGEQELRYAERRNCITCGRLERLQKGEVRGDVRVAGYLTAKQKKARTGSFRGEQTIYMVEDGTGSVTVRVPTKSLGTLGARMKALIIGDFVAIEGWWAGDVLFAKNFDNPIRRTGNKAYQEART